MIECSRPACANPVIANGLCDDHYSNEYPRGTLAFDIQRLDDAVGDFKREVAAWAQAMMTNAAAALRRRP